MSHDPIFRAVLVALVLVFLPILFYHRLKSQATGEKLDRKQEGLFILLTLRPVGLATMLSFFAYLINPEWMAWSSLSLPVWLRWSGVAIGILGGVLFVWTVRTLGKNLTDTVVTRKDHELVTNGPYHWVRHPFYVAMLLFVTGNALAAANWFFLLGGLLVFLLLNLRIRTEEEKLRERFGEAYESYRARTGRFLPRMG